MFIKEPYPRLTNISVPCVTNVLYCFPNPYHVQTKRSSEYIIHTKYICAIYIILLIYNFVDLCLFLSIVDHINLVSVFFFYRNVSNIDLKHYFVKSVNKYIFFQNFYSLNLKAYNLKIV